MQRFEGHQFYVKLSTGATYQLYGALISLANRRAPEDDLSGVSAFLASRRNAKHQSGEGFSLVSPPPEIASRERLRLLAELLGELARELCQEEPDGSLCDISWDRERRLHWLTFALDLRQLVLDSAGGLAAEPLALPLSPTDQLRCDLERTMWKLTILIRSTRRHEPGAPLDNGAIDRLDPEKALPVLGRAIELCSALPEADPARARLAWLHHARGELLAAQGERQAAAIALRTAASYESDVELREVLLEMAQLLTE